MLTKYLKKKTLLYGPTQPRGQITNSPGRIRSSHGTNILVTTY